MANTLHDAAPTLMFSNPVFNHGWNLSVRRGEKWKGAQNAKIDLGNHQVSPVIPLSTTSCLFYQLTDDMLADEHDPACRTVKGLFKVMCELYPDFSLDDVVTLVRFHLTPDGTSAFAAPLSTPNI